MVGALLVLGLLTRAAALVAIALTANLLLATSRQGAAFQIGNEALLAIELAVLIAGAGRSLGMDARLARKRPRVWLW